MSRLGAFVTPCLCASARQWLGGEKTTAKIAIRRLPGRSLAVEALHPGSAAAVRVPGAEIYVIDVSFSALKDPAELAYLNEQPTSFVLPAEAVDRLRAAAGTIIMDSPEFKRLLKDVGATIVPEPSHGVEAASPPAVK